MDAVAFQSELSVMRLSRYRFAPASAARPAFMTLTLIIALALAGCSGSQTAYTSAEVPTPRLAMEDDGMPSQIPPLRRNKPEADDPREPFSPNYGPVAQSQSPAAKPTPTQQPSPNGTSRPVRTRFAAVVED
jgi:hypothetical protein